MGNGISSVAAAVSAASQRMRPARPPLQDRATAQSFTLIEVVIVMAIILVLAGLILATSGYVQNKGRRSRAEAEIAAISAALENYKADNGIYPRGTDSDALKPNSMGDPTTSAYRAASLSLYTAISGDANNDPDRIAESKAYFSFKPNQLSPTVQNQKVDFIRDPFGNSYGYSTVKASAPSGADGYNPTFDLWSTSDAVDTTASPDQSKWIKNW
ncbi:MAG: ral secretion pathway protein [Verrucomicrobiota bacterium]|jgi:prepilin-type N-terminal cleavage/methylation domain-containing protein